MSLRPAPAHWFETYVPRNQTVYALEALAATGVVQLELDPALTEPLALEPVSGFIERFRKLRERHRSLLPAAKRSAEGLVRAPEITAREALQCLERWSAGVDRLLERGTQLEAERQNLLLVRECCSALRTASLENAQLSQKSRFLYKGVFACPHSRELGAEVCAVIDEFVPGPEHNFFVVTGEPACRATVERVYKAQRCISVEAPDWLATEPDEQKRQIEQRLAELDTQITAARQQLEEKDNDPAVATALGDIDLLTWFLDHARQVASVRKLCHVTGWTTAEDVEALREAFHHNGIHGAIRFARAPGYSQPPVYMGLPWWARPFLFIGQMLGTPDSTEVDTSRLLPVIVPLLFGYMFPDIGHGLMLLLFSAAMYRRWPQGRFLIPCGISAMLFGLVFGEFFGLEDVLDPLWFRPLENPLEILLAPLLFGAGLMLLGLVFNGAEAVWRGEARQWLFRDAAVLVLYTAALVALFLPQALWVAMPALLWYLLGHLLIAPANRLASLGSGVGALLQSAFELAMNTLSFLRVGAFALAHAALSSAVIGLTEGVSNPVLHLVLLALGHVFIVVVEGMLAFVQTTRLVLFEFFSHFLRAEGRMFSPMTEPPESPGGGRS